MKIRVRKARVSRGSSSCFCAMDTSSEVLQHGSAASFKSPLTLSKLLCWRFWYIMRHRLRTPEVLVASMGIGILGRRISASFDREGSGMQCNAICSLAPFAKSSAHLLSLVPPRQWDQDSDSVGWGMQQLHAVCGNIGKDCCQRDDNFRHSGTEAGWQQCSAMKQTDWTGWSLHSSFRTRFIF